MVDLDSEDDHVDGALERAQARLYRGDLAANGVFWCCAVAIGKPASSDSKVARTENGRRAVDEDCVEAIYLKRSSFYIPWALCVIRCLGPAVRLAEALWHTQ